MPKPISHEKINRTSGQTGFSVLAGCPPFLSFASTCYIDLDGELGAICSTSLLTVHQSAEGSVAESAKAFIAGGFGGVAAVLVGVKSILIPICIPSNILLLLRTPF